MTGNEGKSAMWIEDEEDEVGEYLQLEERERIVKLRYLASGLTYGRKIDLDDDRVQLRGVNISATGEVYPRVGRVDFIRMQEVFKESDDSVLDWVLQRFCKPKTEAWSDYMAVRSGRRQERADGLGEHSVVKSAVPRYVPPWERRLIEKKEKANAKKGGAKVKTYTLSQVLSDTYIRDKYEIPVRLINSLRTMAVTAPADAAATAAEYLQAQSTVKLRVEAASYSTGLLAAKRSIHRLAITQPPLQANVVSLIAGQVMTMMGDQDTPEEWCVQGPLCHAETIVDIYRLAVAGGKHETIFLFAEETAKLRIDIYIGNHCVSPTVIGHVGDVSSELSDEGTLAALTEAQLSELENLKLGVLSVDGNRTCQASALQLERRAVLINQHVVEEVENPVVSGKSLEAKTWIADDVWVSKVVGPVVPWKFRAAEVGEYAFVMYRNMRGVSLSPLFQVKSVNGVRLLSELVDGMGAGMSGGAVLALSDLSLLGIHSGASNQRLIATAITSTLYQDVCEYITRSESACYSDDSIGDAMLELFTTRRLEPQLLNVVASLFPVFESDNFVGSALRLNDKLVSSCVYGNARSGFGEEIALGETNGFYRSSTKVDGESVQLVRPPNLYEPVVVVGTDGKSPFITSELRVRFRAVHGSHFITSPPTALLYPVTGGAVVSLQDGAVLGTVVRASTSEQYGLQLFCASLPEGTQYRVDPATELARLFPRLEAKWGEDALNACFTHHSALEDTSLSDGLVKMGEFALSVRLKLELRKAGLERDALIVSRRLLNTDVVAGLAMDLGLMRMVKTGDGVNVVTSVAAAERVMYGLVALVVMYESEQVASQWLDMLGLVPYHHRFQHGAVLQPPAKLMRRASESGVDDGSGRVLLPAE